MQGFPSELYDPYNIGYNEIIQNNISILNALDVDLAYQQNCNFTFECKEYGTTKED